MADQNRRDSAGPFGRDGGRLRFTARTGVVRNVEQVSPELVRVTFGGADFADFVSEGPADHIRLFFPEPATGEYLFPTPVGPADDGIVRPDGPMIARDFTPLPRSAGGGVEVDVDFYTHANPGPASGWAMRARVGDELVIVGPRGTRRAPQGIDGLVLLVDETSLPSAYRWLRSVPKGVRADVIAAVHGNGDWVSDYLGVVDGVDATVHLVAPEPASGATLDALASLGPIGDATFVWAAGEASALVPVRRQLRRTLELGPDQAVVSGYWRRGVVAFDHHEPVDPSDPD